MKVFFWQNMPSHIQMGTLDNFASLWDGEVHGIWCEDIYPARRKLGWESLKPRHLRETYLSATGWEEEVVAIHQKNPDSIHILSAIGAYPPVDMVAKLESKTAAPRLGLIVDPAILLGWKGLLRPLKTRWVYRPYLDKISTVFAMGFQGVEYYRRAGFKDHQLYPFLYTSPYGRMKEPSPVHDPLKFAYVGQLHRRKGVDLLILALSQLKELSWSLGIYGCGPEEKSLKEMVAQFGLGDRVFFCGVIPASDIVKTLHQYDVCCVPSRFDGWGVVTNEAFQAGLPSVVSDAASSSELIRPSGVGKVFPVGQVSALREALRDYVVSPSRVREEKKLALAFAPRIEPEAVAHYLLQSLNFGFLSSSSRPFPSWL